MSSNYARYPQATRHAYVRCLHPVKGLNPAHLYRVIEVLKDDGFYWGQTLRVFDVDESLPAPDNRAGYFPWRFELVIFPLEV